MKKTAIVKYLWIPLFFGSLWGFCEATLGYVLHFVSPISGLIMFPIGFYFMMRAFKEANNISAITLTAAVAAGIKFLDFFLPLQNPAHVINPAIAIMLEALLVGAFFLLFDAKKKRFMFFEALLPSAGWRALYLGYLAVFAASTGMLSGTAWDITKFLVIDSIVNALIIAGLVALARSKNCLLAKFLYAHYSLAIFAFILAAGTQLLIVAI